MKGKALGTRDARHYLRPLTGALTADVPLRIRLRRQRRRFRVSVKNGSLRRGLM